ncbi:MAG: aldo/keto reductase, partial [Planctomycetota bacterium]
VTAGLTVGRAGSPGGGGSAAAQPVAGHGGVKVAAGQEPPTRDRLGELLPMRRLGRTDEWVTAFCFGGSHLIHEGQSDREHQELLEAAIEEGVRFFDTAQQYGRGKSERVMGKHLTPKYRDSIYVMTKTQATEATRARRDMDECRKRLNVDVIDLMQMHHIESARNVDQRIDNGVVDVLLEAREQGKIRHLGFTGHDTPSAHLRMLERLEQMGVEFDTCQMPVNVVDPGYESFVERVLPVLVERDYGVLAMKTLVFGALTGRDHGWRRRDRIAPNVVPEVITLAEALGFAWSLPVASLVSGTPRVDWLRENTQVLRDHQQFDEAKRLELIDKVAEFAGPRVEFYKTEV